MLIRSVLRPCLARRLLLWAVLAACLWPPAAAQQPAAPTVAQALEQAKLALDQVEETLKNETVPVETLAGLRRTIVTVREELRTRIEALEPRAAEIEARLKQLGPAPAKDAPPEEPAVAAERERIAQEFSQVDGNLKQARLLATRTEQLSDRISERQRATYARQLLERGPSVLDPSFWLEAAAAIPGEGRALSYLLQSWGDEAATEGTGRIVAALALIAAVLAALVWFARWWGRRVDSAGRAHTRFARARWAVWVFICVTVRVPLAVLAIVLVLEAFSLLPYRVDEIAYGLVVATLAAGFGRGAARGLLAPTRPERRLVKLDDPMARCLHDHLALGAVALGIAIFVQVVHKTLYTPVALTVATNALFAMAVAALLVHLLRCMRRAEAAAGEEATAVPGAQLAAWVLAIAIAVALVAGYAALAAFIALRAVVGAAILAALYLFLVATDALFGEALASDTRRARSLAANLGVSPQNIGVVGVLLSAGIRLMLIVLAVTLIVGPWEVSTADLTDTMQSVPLGFRIGEISISFRAIFTAGIVLAAVLLITRWAQRWLTREFLPRTSLEPSLQLSVATIFGYGGAIVAVTLAMASLGIDLQKIALVAGALSVGIGFGLQSIVSNFVSGLILLAERPIRVGDSIVVQGEEGWVRRIRVRATEIETYERASVIIPNSALITGMVKNWTHANTMSRVVIKVGVGYDSDPEKVREILLSIADANPMIVKNPPPGAFFMGFGDSALEFQMFCVVANMANGLTVRNDLNVAIFKAFRDAGIEIPYPKRDVHVRGASGADAAAPGAGG